MQFCKCTVQHNGELGMEIPGKIVSVPEIEILKFIHGRDAVNKIVMTEDPGHLNEEGERVEGFNFDQHIEYLRSTYGNKPVEAVYGTVVHKLPLTLREIGIDPDKEADAKREAARRLLAEADALDGKSSAVDEVTHVSPLGEATPPLPTAAPPPPPAPPPA